MEGKVFLVCHRCGNKKTMSISEYENQNKRIYCCRELVEPGFFNDKYREHFYSVEAVVEQNDSKSDEISADHSETREEIDELTDDVRTLKSSLNDLKGRVQMLEIEKSQLSNIIYNMGIDQAKDEFKKLQNQIMPILTNGKKSIAINIKDSDSWRSKYRDLFNRVFLKHLEKITNADIVTFTEEFLIHCKPRDIVGPLTTLEAQKYVFFEVSSRTLNTESNELLNSAISRGTVDWVIGQGPSARTIEMPVNQLRYIVVNLDEVHFSYSHFISISF